MNRLTEILPTNKNPQFDYYMVELRDQIDEFPELKPFFEQHISDIMEAFGDLLNYPPQLGFYQGKPILEFQDPHDQKLYDNFLQRGIMNSIRNPN